MIGAERYPLDRAAGDTASIDARPHNRRLSGAAQVALGVAILLIVGLLLRLPSIDTPSVEQRENQSSLLARGWYIGSGDDLPAAKRAALEEVDTVLKPFEPPLLELAAAGFFRITNGERIWFPRLLSSLAWLIGGALLALVARRITSAVGILTAVAVYVVWPYAAWHSRKFMPDALLVACLLAAALAIIRFWERPTRARFLLAGGSAAIATAIKPGVALLILTALFVGLVIENGRLHDEMFSGRLPLFVGLSASLALGYLVVGRYLTDFVNPDAATERLAPDLVLTTAFWTGWWEMVSFLLRFPQEQELVAVAALAVGALGLALVPKGAPRAILWSLLGGYVAFALAFASYTETHPYYALPLIPILSIAIGVVVARLHNALEGRTAAQVAVVVVVAVVVGIGAQRTYAMVTTPADLTRIADYEEIGEITNHTTRAIIVDPRLSHPIMYWGWIVGQSWELDYNDELPAWVDANEKDFLIVVGNDQLAHPGLHAFVRDRPVVARTDRYAIFRILGDRGAEG